MSGRKIAGKNAKPRNVKPPESTTSGPPNRRARHRAGEGARGADPVARQRGRGDGQATAQLLIPSLALLHRRRKLPPKRRRNPFKPRFDVCGKVCFICERFSEDGKAHKNCDIYRGFNL